jgi:hypothetical protein
LVPLQSVTAAASQRLSLSFLGQRLRGAKTYSWERRATRSIRRQPRSPSCDASIYPKPDRIVSSSSVWLHFLDRQRAEAFVGHPTEVGNEREALRRFHTDSPRRKKRSASLGLFGHRSDPADRESFGLRAGSLLVPKPQRDPARGAESLPPTCRVGTEMPT